MPPINLISNNNTKTPNMISFSLHKVRKPHENRETKTIIIKNTIKERLRTYKHTNSHTPQYEPLV